MTTAPPLDTSVLSRNNVKISGNPAGRPLIFAHGFGCSQEMWRLVAPAFESDYTVVLFDHVGAGGSDLSAYDRAKYDSLHGYAYDVLEILDTLDLSDAVYVGHSVSAMVGVLASTHDPSRFGSLVLVGPSPRYVDDVDYTGGFTQADIDGLLDTLDSNYLGWSSQLAPLIMGNSERPELGEELTSSFCRVDPAIASHFAHVTFTSDNREDLKNVVTPTLILQCNDDIIAPMAVGQFVHGEIAGSSLVVLDATGHCPNLSSPAEVVTRIQEFLR